MQQAYHYNFLQDHHQGVLAYQSKIQHECTFSFYYTDEDLNQYFYTQLLNRKVVDLLPLMIMIAHFVLQLSCY